MTTPGALAFDLFGTVVDWRSGVARESALRLPVVGLADVDPHDFADAWRALYQPAMAEVRDGQRPFEILDVLHREMLETALADHGVDTASLDPELLADWALAWRRLDPWPDAAEGLARLRARFPVVTLSNANVALALAMARRGGLVWDAILGAEWTRAYKPAPEAYLRTAEILRLPPERVVLVAAHHGDLAAARRCGLLTAHVDRPMEHGGAPAPDAAQAQDWTWRASGLPDLADQLGA